MVKGLLLIRQHQLDLFQEWPQLLDPLLPELVNPLVDYFLRSLLAGGYKEQSPSRVLRPGVSSLECAICCILNALCKVRGVKVITRFLNNEPRYLESMLGVLLRKQSDMIWQERYIMLLWLSHLVLTPFDLQSVSSTNERLSTQTRLTEKLQHERLPNIARALISAGLENLGVASKERESARRLIVRIALRPDMQRLGLLDDLVKLTIGELHNYTHKPAASMYECLGYLSILSGIMKSGSANDVLPFLTSTFNFALKAATAESADFTKIRDSAPARKTLVVILRASTMHAVSLKSRDGSEAISDDVLYGMLEEMIQQLLGALGDKDTPVRLAASKALSMLAQSLEEDMKAEVVQAVLDTFEEDVLYETPDSAYPIPARLLTNEEMKEISRNVTAVNAQKWQGLLLTLGHLLFRRTAPASQLSPVLKSLLLGLDFEQRSAGANSIGGAVRDAACFGFWSLGRKYATSDLQALDPASVLPVSKATFPRTDEPSILQIVTDQLVVSACLDPSGNIRRGSSAALQELVGRHPDTIIEGIALVQVVDYHVVARLSRAMLDVAQDAAQLADVYKWALLNALFGWRGVRAVDDNSRRTAAIVISKLISLGSSSDWYRVLDTVQMQLSRLPVENSKTVAETRHGLLMTVSRVLDTFGPTDGAYLNSACGSTFATVLQVLWEGVRMNGQVLGSLDGRFVSELILEGAASLVSSLARQESRDLSKWSEHVIQVIDLCLTRAENEFALVACTEAAFEMLSRLPVSQKADIVRNWLDPKHQRLSSYSCKGRILALGSVYATLPEYPTANHVQAEESCRSRVFAQLRQFIQGDWPIETQVTALHGLRSTIPHLKEENIEEPLCAALDNYANDQRGDVGSLTRLEAVKSVLVLLAELTRRGNAMSNYHHIQPLVQRLFRLAGEKLDKLRFEAWKCIEMFLTIMKCPPIQW